jgi:hypothetical protein
MLSFDFTSSDSFSRLTLFVDGPGTTAGTFYIDDVEQAETMVPGFDSGLLANGDFENGVDPWIGNGANVVTDSGNSFNQVDVTAAGNPFDVNLSQVVEITQGTNYILTFDASSDRERTMLAGIGLNEAPFTNTAPSVNLTTETQTFTLQLSAADFGGANSRVLFDMGAEVGVVVIDNVSLVEGGDSSDSNGGGGFDSGLLANGDFENGVDPWIGNGANVVTDSGNSFNQVDVTAAGNPFDVNLSQVVEITQGTNYILSFDASSDRERTMLAGIGLNEAPFTNTAPSVDLTTETQTFTLQLSAADFGGANSRVLFDMGAEVGVVVIDNVSLVEGGDGSDSNGGGGNTGDESPFCRTQIQAFAGDAGSDIFLSVFNVDSETMRIEIESADADPVDLLVFPAGLWNPVPGISSAPAEVSPGVWAGEFFFPGGAPENVEFFIEWSKVSFAGNWRSSAPDTLDTVPFNATCDTSSGGGNGGCTGSAVAATTLPLDFEGCESFVSSFSSIGDGGVVPSLDANPSKSGINTSDNVLKVVRASGINRWGGIQNSFPQGVIDITTQVFKIKVYSSVPDVTYRFELALDPQTDPVTGNPPPVFRQVSGGANTWTEIEFTFTGLPASPTTYNQLVIKPDNPDGSDGEVTTEERVFYFDDLRLE